MKVIHFVQDEALWTQCGRHTESVTEVTPRSSWVTCLACIVHRRKMMQKNAKLWTRMEQRERERRRPVKS